MQQPVLACWPAGPWSGTRGGTDPVRRAIAERLDDDERLAELGVAVVGVWVLAVRADPDLERSLQNPPASGLAEAAAEEAKLATLRDSPGEVLGALTLRELAGHLPEAS